MSITTKGPWPWPASRVTPEMMRAMHRTREATLPRKPISMLVAEAVQDKYGSSANQTPEPEEAA